MYKKFTAFIFMMLLILSSFSFSTFAAGTEIRQVLTELPSIAVEVTGSKSESDIKSATIGKEKLKYKSVTKGKDATKLVYMLVDISTSMSQATLNALKDSLIDYAISLGDDDKLVLVSFGIDYETILSGGESDDEIRDAINSLRCNSDGTSFYNALNYVYENSLKQKGYDRSFAIVVSDGTDEDNEKGRSSRQEVVDNYETHRLPVYGMCLSHASKSQAEEFGYISRVSGGELMTYSSYNAESVFDSMKETIDDVTVVKFTSRSKKSQGTQTLTVEIDGESLEQDILVLGGNDKTAPSVETVEYNKDKNAFVITFSEEVEHADDEASYEVKKGGSNLTIVSAEYKDKQATLNMDKAVYSGKYTFSFNGITDTSDNANNLETIEIEQKVKARPVIIKLLIILGILMIPVGFLAALYLILLNLKKKKNVETIKEIFVTQVEEKESQQVHIQQPVGMQLKFYIDAGNGQFHTVDYNLISSIIVGRTDMCDLYVDDRNMSSQHFAIEQVEKGIAITDLQTTNGTFVNGVRILSPTFVKSGDKILAGNSTITIVYTVQN